MLFKETLDKQVYLIISRFQKKRKIMKAKVYFNFKIQGMQDQESVT